MAPPEDDKTKAAAAALADRAAPAASKPKEEPKAEEPKEAKAKPLPKGLSELAKKLHDSVAGSGGAARLRRRAAMALDDLLSAESGK